MMRLAPRHGHDSKSRALPSAFLWSAPPSLDRRACTDCQPGTLRRGSLGQRLTEPHGHNLNTRLRDAPKATVSSLLAFFGKLSPDRIGQLAHGPALREDAMLETMTRLFIRHGFWLPLVGFLLLAPPVRADWPMARHDPLR